MIQDPLTQYEAVSKDGAAAVKGLMSVREKLGNPTDCSNNVGWVMLDNIVQVWQKYWPWEMKDWVERLKVELDTERTIKDAIKAEGGYFPVSYPTRLYKMIHALLPEQKLNDKEFLRGLVSRYPFLQSTNAKI